MSDAMVTAQVVNANEVPPRASESGFGVRPTLGPQTGFQALAQAVLECGPGRAQVPVPEDIEEVLFVLEGRGRLVIDGEVHELEPETGAYIAPGETFAIENDGPSVLRAVAVRVPGWAGPAPGGSAGPRAVVRRLEEQAAGEATTQREFRIVADPATGLRSATHFVGYIPTARAPNHFHSYDEVIYVLDGEGVFHAGGEHTPLSEGSCIQLPARTIHCLENTGSETMRVVAVFRPAGSPAAAYYPDGTPAYGGAPPLDPQRRRSNQ
jgi:mannose-6-phosphate isomerase-like protein (cupin superfamily)